jgi:glycosyltransferase involved in cell wall biosynthesis
VQPRSVSVAVVHDYLTQRGGAERVALLMAETFPEAPLYTSLYDPAGTFPEFSRVNVETLALNRIDRLRHDHRLAFPLLAPAFSAQAIDADVVLCSSSGWAHGVRTEGRKVVYCYSPAHWLYQQRQYLGSSPEMWRERRSPLTSVRGFASRASLQMLAGPLRAWDRRAAASADTYLTSSTAIAQAIRDVYRIEAEVLPPPPAIGPDGPEAAVEGLHPGYALCIARLLPYKNVDAVVGAMRFTEGTELVVVGDGPGRSSLQQAAGPNVRFMGTIDDDTLRWLYRNAAVLVAAAYEDYGLTVLEAGAFGHPAVVLRGGGFLDTVIEGETGLFFDEPRPRAIADALGEAARISWNAATIIDHSHQYSRVGFAERMREVVLGT